MMDKDQNNQKNNDNNHTISMIDWNKSLQWSLLMIQSFCFFMKLLFIWICSPLSTRCQTYCIAYELDKINVEMKNLRQQYEDITRKYHQESQRIQSKRSELNDRKDQLILRLSRIDTWSTDQQQQKQSLKSLEMKNKIIRVKSSSSLSSMQRKNDVQSIGRYIDTKSMAEWFDRKFSCGTWSSPKSTIIKPSTLSKLPKRSLSIRSNNDNTPNDGVNLNDTENNESSQVKPRKIILKRCTSLNLPSSLSAPSSPSSAPSSPSKLNVIDENNNNNNNNNNNENNEIFDQMLTNTLNEFRSNDSNGEMNKKIRELYDDPNWKPMIDQLRNEYQIFSNI